MAANTRPAFTRAPSRTWSYIAMVVASLFAAGCASQRGHDPSLKQGAKEVGQSLGTATREIGQGAKKVGKTIGDAAKEGGKAFKKAIKSE